MHRHRENPSANIGAYCLLFLLFIILTVSTIKNGKTEQAVTPPAPATTPGTKTMNGCGLLLVLIILLFSLTTVYYVEDEPNTNTNSGTLIVYGASWCGWTTKQRQFLDQNNIQYEYIECGDHSDSRCNGTNGFPTLQYEGTTQSGAILSIDKLHSDLGY